MRKYTDESTFELNGKHIVFRYVSSATLSQKMDIVDDIVHGVINDTVGYEPILFDYFVAVSLVNNLTDIALPESFTESADFIEKTRIGQVIKETVNIKDVIDAAERKIDFERSKLVNTSKLDELFEVLISIANKYSSTLENLNTDDFMNKLQNVAELAKMPQDDVVRGILAYENSQKEQDNTKVE